jgi:hypothetical protein
MAGAKAVGRLVEQYDPACHLFVVAVKVDT